jgi:hypothetical protein
MDAVVFPIDLVIKLAMDAPVLRSTLDVALQIEVVLLAGRVRPTDAADQKSSSAKPPSVAVNSRRIGTPCRRTAY